MFSPSRETNYRNNTDYVWDDDREYKEKFNEDLYEDISTVHKYTLLIANQENKDIFTYGLIEDYYLKYNSHMLRYLIPTLNYLKLKSIVQTQAKYRVLSAELIMITAIINMVDNDYDIISLKDFIKDDILPNKINLNNDNKYLMWQILTAMQMSYIEIINSVPYKEFLDNDKVITAYVNMLKEKFNWKIHSIKSDILKKDLNNSEFINTLDLLRTPSFEANLGHYQYIIDSVVSKFGILSRIQNEEKLGFFSDLLLHEICTTFLSRTL